MNLTVPPSCVVETPPALAKAMTLAVGGKNKRWMDPCAGPGAFPKAIIEEYGETEIQAIDIEPNAWGGSAKARTLIQDFNDRSKKLRKADIVICNPPYVPLSKLEERLLERSTGTSSMGLTCTASASYWLPFLIRSLEVLKHRGNIAFVLPAAYDYAFYAQEAREEIPKLFRHFEVHRCQTPLFDQVSDGCIVILGYGYGADHRSEFRFEYETREQLIVGLKRGRKKRERSTSRKRCRKYPVTLDSIIDVGIGAVTGDAKYFLLTDVKRKELKIDLEDCLPVLTKSNHICSPVISFSCRYKLIAKGERCYLFKPRGENSMTEGAKSYISLGQAGDCQTANFKVSNRDTWYDVPVPENIHGVFSGMFSRYPRIALVSNRLNCTNTLYWFRFKQDTTYAQAKAFLMSLYTSRVSRAIRRSAKRYPDGLLKLEPSHLKSLPLVPMDLEKPIQRSDLQKVQSLVAFGNLDEANRIADSFVLRKSKSK